MNLFIHTLGCKVNQYESQGMAELFSANGFELCSEAELADVIIVNSCTVTAESDRKTRQAVRHFKTVNPTAAVILTGCMSEAFPEDAARLEGADIVVGNKNYGRILEVYREYTEGRGERLCRIEEHKRGDSFSTPSITSFNERTRAYIKIEDGCDRFCSYCVIPRARGRVRSRDLDDIVKEASALAASGHHEVVLVGINLTAYGKDNGLELCDAVEAIADIDGIERIRFGSMEPDQISDATLKRLAACEKFCPQFHLSLQSGCDATLKRMNRHYDSEFYLQLVKKIEAMFDNPSVTTDIMVGFAGESEEDFEASRAFAEKIGFARMHVFAYSRRAGTAAYSYPDQITNAEKARRSRLMTETAEALEQAFCAAQAGRLAGVLFEEERDGCSVGYTENYTRVFVNSSEPLHGKILKVKLTGTCRGGCTGELVE